MELFKVWTTYGPIKSSLFADNIQNVINQLLKETIYEQKLNIWLDIYKDIIYIFYYTFCLWFELELVKLNQEITCYPSWQYLTCEIGITEKINSHATISWPGYQFIVLCQAGSENRSLEDIETDKCGNAVWQTIHQVILQQNIYEI